MLLAEDLLLILTDDATGKLVTSGSNADVALGGALLCELSMTGRVDVAGPDERVRQGRLVVRNGSPTGDRLLDDALAVVGRREGKKPRGVVGRLGTGARERLSERLVERGLLRAEDGRILGIVPTHRWPSANIDHESSVRTGLVAALREGSTSDARTGALISLLFALKAVHRAVDPASIGLSKQAVNENATRIAEGVWAAKAVRQAIDDMFVDDMSGL